ncbi:hypothetical protein GCM10027589_31940 [Actinocorallia lasiicapitis]
MKRREWLLDGRPQAVRVARAVTVETLAEWALGEPVQEAAEQVVAELVMNAVVHAAPPVRLSLQLKGEAVVVEVEDGSPALPAPRLPGEGGGFGLALVASVARLSTSETESGKAVRALIDLSG